MWGDRQHVWLSRYLGPSTSLISKAWQHYELFRTGTPSKYQQKAPEL